MESSQSIGERDAELPDFDDAEQPVAGPLAFEAGQIGPTSGTLQPDCSFRFMANDLDAAVRSAKKMKKAKKARSKNKKKTMRRKLQEMDSRIFVSRTSHFLKESKRYLIRAAVERLGIHIVNDLVLEVKTIEANGGQMILKGNRRRTPGGVLWNILRSRYKEDYKAIMSAGRSHKKQRKQQKEEKQKRKLEKIVMVIDGQPVTKRQREEEPESDMVPPAARVKRTGVTVWPSRRTQVDDIQFKVESENLHMQNACVEGVEKGTHISCFDDVEMFDDTIKER